MFYVILTGDEAPSRARPFQTQQQAEHAAMSIPSTHGPLVVQPSTGQALPATQPDYITQAALAHEFFQLFEARLRVDDRQISTFDRTLGGLLLLAERVSQLLTQMLVTYEHGVFTYEEIELTEDQRQRVVATAGSVSPSIPLSAFVWSLLDDESLAELAENYRVPAELEEWVKEWLIELVDRRRDALIELDLRHPAAEQ